MIAHGADEARSQRIAVVAILMLLSLGLLGVRVAQLSVVDGEGLAARSAHQYRQQIRLPAPRGGIFAATGEILAETVSVATVFASPRYDPVPAELHPRIARMLGVDLATVERRLNSDKGYVNLARRVPRERADAVLALRLAGVGIVEESRRRYPQGELAAHVLGFANSEMDGAEGLELRYDRWLRAPELVYDVERDGKGPDPVCRGRRPARGGSQQGSWGTTGSDHRPPGFRPLSSASWPPGSRNLQRMPGRLSY